MGGCVLLEACPSGPLRSWDTLWVVFVTNLQFRLGTIKKAMFFFFSFWNSLRSLIHWWRRHDDGYISEFFQVTFIQTALGYQFLTFIFTALTEQIWGCFSGINLTADSVGLKGLNCIAVRTSIVKGRLLFPSAVICVWLCSPTFHKHAESQTRGEQQQ